MHDFFVVKDRMRYTAIDRTGQPVIGGFLTQRAAFRALEKYQQAQAEIAEAANLMDGWAL